MLGSSQCPGATSSAAAAAAAAAASAVAAAAAAAGMRASRRREAMAARARKQGLLRRLLSLFQVSARHLNNLSMAVSGGATL